MLLSLISSLLTANRQNNVDAFSTSGTHSSLTTQQSRPQRMSSPQPLHMVSSMAPPSQAEIQAASFTTSDRRHEKELLRQISIGMQRKQKKKRHQKKRNNNKTAPRIETDILTNQQRPVRIVRTDPSASSRKVVQAQLQDYMPTDTLTPSTTRRGRLLTLSKEEEGDISDSIQDLREVLRIRDSSLQRSRPRLSVKKG